MIVLLPPLTIGRVRSPFNGPRESHYYVNYLGVRVFRAEGAIPSHDQGAARTGIIPKLRLRRRRM